MFVNPPDAEMAERLKRVRTIAVVGLSDKPMRDSYGVASYLDEVGYTVVPVNPAISMWEGHQSFPDLAMAQRAARSVGKDIDMVVVFRDPKHVPRVVEEILSLKIKAAWFELGVIDWKSAERARTHGVWTVMDHCVAVEHRKLIGAPAV